METHTHIPQIAEVIMSKKNKAGGGIKLPDFRIYYTSLTINITRYSGEKKRHNDQWKRIENPEMNTCVQSVGFDQGAEYMQWEKECPQMVLGKLIFVCKRIERDLAHTICKTQFQMG
jgi:hypothetical protein